MTALNKVAKELDRLLPGAVQTCIPLSEISRWRIGGIADVMVSPRSTEELSALRSWIHKRDLPSVVIGATTNLLFADEGLRAIGIRIGQQFASLKISGNRIIADPGVWVPGVARRSMQAGLSGIEHICGIPGTLGGLVCMNGGSQRKGIGDHVVNIQSVNSCGKLVLRSHSQCDFGYRTSVFQSNNEIISQIELELDTSTDKHAVRKRMLSILSERRKKFPQKLPNCGSTFVSDPAMYAEYGPPGKIIEKIGFKGYRHRGAVVSPVHANFIINDLPSGGACAKDVLHLIKTIKQEVTNQTGYKMNVEARFISQFGEVQEI